jgi:hypothetical protein
VCRKTHWDKDLNGTAYRYRSCRDRPDGPFSSGVTNMIVRILIAVAAIGAMSLTALA